MKAQHVDTRGRLIAAATRLFQTQGYHATGVAEILVDAQAPKGSLYHHFPDGKAGLAVAAVAQIEADIVTLIARAQARGATAPALVKTVARGMADWLRRSDGEQGSLFSVLALECAPREPLVRDAVRKAYSTWREALAAAIPGPRKRATAHANLIVAALEGALILARVDGDEAPLLAVADAIAAALDEKS